MRLHWGTVTTPMTGALAQVLVQQMFAKNCALTDKLTLTIEFVSVVTYLLSVVGN